MSYEFPSNGTVREAEPEWKAEMPNLEARSSTSVLALPGVSANFGVEAAILVLVLLLVGIGDLGCM